MIATMTMNAAVTVILTVTVTVTVTVKVTVNVNVNVNVSCFGCYLCIKPSLGYARGKFSIFWKRLKAFQSFKSSCPLFENRYQWKAKVSHFLLNFDMSVESKFIAIPHKRPVRGKRFALDVYLHGKAGACGPYEKALQ